MGKRSVIKSCMAAVLCIRLATTSAAQTVAPADNQIKVRQLSVTKLVDKNLKPTKVEFSILLDTGGRAISKVVLFYKNSRVEQYAQSTCVLSTDLHYETDVPYADTINYYLLATPVEGADVAFEHQTLVASDLQAWKQVRSPFAAILAGSMGSLAGFLALGVGATSPGPGAPKSAQPSSGGPNYSVKVGATVGAAVAVMVFLFWKHRKAVKRQALVGLPNPSVDSDKQPLK